jgi:hypothetical protein
LHGENKYAKCKDASEDASDDCSGPRPKQRPAKTGDYTRANACTQIGQQEGAESNTVTIEEVGPSKQAQQETYPAQQTAAE